MLHAACCLAIVPDCHVAQTVFLLGAQAAQERLRVAASSHAFVGVGLLQSVHEGLQVVRQVVLRCAVVPRWYWLRVQRLQVLHDLGMPRPG
jgi:hypothetical protein